MISSVFDLDYFLSYELWVLVDNCAFDVEFIESLVVDEVVVALA